MERAKYSQVSSVLVIYCHIYDLLIMNFIKNKITDPDGYEWTRELMYKWDENNNFLVATQLNEVTNTDTNTLETPQLLTCFENLFVTYVKHLGGCAYGPPGSGKTQSIVDMGQALVIYTVVIFNCSPSVSAVQMTALFKGVIQSGVWARK